MGKLPGIIDMPKIGHREGGYILTGPNAADKNSWTRESAMLGTYSQGQGHIEEGSIVDALSEELGKREHMYEASKKHAEERAASRYTPTEGEDASPFAGQTISQREPDGGIERDIDGNLTKRGQEQLQQAIDMAQGSSGIVKPSGKFGKILKDVSKRVDRLGGGGEFLKVKGVDEIPISTKLSREEGGWDSFFSRHDDAADLLSQEDLFKSRKTGFMKEVGGLDSGDVAHYLHNEDAVRGAGGASYEIGKPSSTNLGVIKKDYLKRYRKNPNQTNLWIDITDPKTGARMDMMVPENKISSLNEDVLNEMLEKKIVMSEGYQRTVDAGVEAVEKGGFDKLDDAVKADLTKTENAMNEYDALAKKIGVEPGTGYVRIRGTGTKVTPKDQLKTMLDDYVESGGSKESYDAIEEMLKATKKP